MADDSDLDKTEPASPQRLQKAREEGDVPRSRELGTCTLLLAAGAALWMIGGNLVQELSVVLSESLRFDRSLAFDPTLLFELQVAQVLQMLVVLAPLAGVLLVVALITPALIGGWLFTAQSLLPKFSRINPLSGLGRMVSVQSLVELIKAIGKTVVVGSVAYLVIQTHYDAIIGLVSEPSIAGLKHAVELSIICFISIAAALIVIIAIDVPYQLRSYANKLRMTRQEVIQENKEAYGNPQVKAKIRRQRREMARRRMMSKVPTADVVITNPSHYAVALKYEEGRMNAPIVVAKGMDLVAAKIRELAQENNVPLLEAPPLARALYAHAELNTPIPEALYNAVAAVLAYVFQLKTYKKHGGLAPNLPDEIDVPASLDPAGLKQPMPLT